LSKKYKVVLLLMRKGGGGYDYFGFATEEEHQKWRVEMTKLGVVYGQGANDYAAAMTYGAGGSPSAQTSVSKVKSFCGGCGTKNEDNEAFCTKCGGSLAT
jgi:hypothetical protein